MSEQISIEQIRRDGGTQSRVQMDESTIADYVEAIEQGGTFPPVTLFYDGTDYWLADGFHRVEAHRRASKTEIQAEVKQGTRREAVLHSVGANASHGLRRTQDDKRRAILTLLEDSEWSKWSDREIANRVGVSPSTVGKYRAEISSVQTGQIERTVSRGGTTYTMKTGNIGDKSEKPLTLAELHNQDRAKFQGDYEESYLLVYTYQENYNNRYLCIASDATRVYARSGAKVKAETITVENEKLPITKLKADDYQTMLESMTGCFVRFEESSLYEVLRHEIPQISTQKTQHYTVPDKKPAPVLSTPQEPPPLDKISQPEGAKLRYIAPLALVDVPHNGSWREAYNILKQRYAKDAILIVKINPSGFVAMGQDANQLEESLSGVEHEGKRVSHYYLMPMQQPQDYGQIFNQAKKQIIYFVWVNNDGVLFWRDMWNRTETPAAAAEQDETPAPGEEPTNDSSENLSGLAEGQTVRTRTGRVGQVESVQGIIANVRTVNGVQPHKIGTLTPVPNKISSPPVRYFGGKFRIAEWIIEQFPRHISYCEPFAGGASILFRKQPSTIEILNDLNGEVVNFFDVLRSRPDELIGAIELTPYSREEHRRAHETSEDPLERARRFYVRSRQSFASGEGKHNSGWRYESNNKRGTTAIDEWNSTEHLWQAASRLKQVQIECDDALRTIQRFDTPDTLFYVDPPYLPETRGSNDDYRHEMTIEQHIELAHVLKNAEGMVILSGYKSELYDELYHDWRCISKDTRANGNAPTTEYLWISPKADSLSRLPLFEGVGVVHE